MVDGYLFIQEVLGYRPYITKRLRELTSNPDVITSMLDRIVLQINLDYMSGKIDKPINDVIDDMINRWAKHCNDRLLTTKKHSKQ